MKAILQYWEESERGWGSRADGCSLHRDLASHQKYVDDVYRDRTYHQYVPDQYDRTIGDPTAVEISENLYQSMGVLTGLRLDEVETNNLLKLNEIRF